MSDQTWRQAMFIQNLGGMSRPQIDRVPLHRLGDWWTQLRRLVRL